MKDVLSNSVGRHTAGKAVALLVLFLSCEFAAPSYLHAVNADPGGASSLSVPSPQGVRVLAQFPLQGPPAARMYTQWEHGRTYLYVEREGANLTAVDLTRKYTPRIVDHQPEQVASPRYQLVEGGPIEVTPSSAAQAGIDNVRDRGTLSVLQATNPRDSELLQFFGPNSSNLVDRDRRLIFFAYPTRLLIVEDDRWYGVDYSIN